MRIVEVCPYDMTRPGGVQVHIRDLAAWVENQGHQVIILAPPPADGSEVARLRSIGRMRPIDFQGTHFELCYASGQELRQLANDMKRFQPDIVHIHTPWTPMLPWQVWRRLKRPSLATFHATLPEDEQDSLMSRFLYFAAGYFIRRLASIIVPSQSPLIPLQRYTDGRVVHILPPTVDLSPWQAAGAEVAKSEGTDVDIVFLGRLETRKGVATLLEAWQGVKDRLPQARLTIAGSGDYASQVQSAAEKDPRLSYLARPDDEAARQLVARSDIFVAPSPYGESFGIVLIEAMAAGAVPVAAANTGYATVMTGPDKGEALLFPPEDAQALSDKLIWLAENPDERARLRTWGKAHAATFDVTSVGPKYLAAFQQALSAKSS